MTPDVAYALIDDVLRSYGMDPAELTSRGGWRHIFLGSVIGVAGLVEWQPGVHYLVVSAPILKMPPPNTPGIHNFYRLLLELNHLDTMAARLSIYEGSVHVSLVRPIRGLDDVEVDDAIRSVMMVADHYDEWLQTALMAFLRRAPLPLSKLPNIQVTPQDARVIIAVLSACDKHGREILSYLMERWQKAGHIVEAGTSGVGLRIAVGSTSYSLGGMRPGSGKGRQIIVLGWEGLRKRGMFSDKDVDRFQAAVSRIGPLKITESTVHIEVTETFTRESARKLVHALDNLAKKAREPEPEPPPVWGPSLPQLESQVGPKTRANIHETLLVCEPHVQQLYALLVDGWGQAGGIVQCMRPGRIYLKFQTREHQFGEAGIQSHRFNLVVLAAPKGKRGPSIDVAWDLGASKGGYMDYAANQVADFERVVASLPGFEQKGTVTRLLVDEAFGLEQGHALLGAMLALKTAGWEE
ncbi:MAG: YbjN domain-containing protein [Anaerolineae bacterium]|nr:YbjN domain-containing protein [Anaerolineae bacterium]